MKVLFVYTDVGVMGLGAKSYHSGIGVLSALLKEHGHETSLCYLYGEFSTSGFLKKVKEFRPDLLAFTSDSTQYRYISRLIGLSKALGIFSVLGGSHASLDPECLNELEGLNAICRGEGEYPLVELVEALKNKKDPKGIKNLYFKADNGAIVKNDTRPFIADLDSLPFADRDLFDYQSIIDSEFGRASFMVSRGCPYNCTFCASPTMGKLQEGNYVRFMSVDRVIDELKYMKKKYRFSSVFFADDTFTVNSRYVMEFCDKYAKNIGIPFELNARVESVNSEVFKALKKSGCYKVHMGIESGDEQFRKDVLNRLMGNERIVSAFSAARKAGLLTKSYNIVGFPYETKEIHERTVELNKRIKPDGLVCYIFQPYPGTKLFDDCRKAGFIDKDLFKKEYVSRRESLLNMKEFTPKEIVACHRKFAYKIFKVYSIKRALFYRMYYSGVGELLIKLSGPFKNILRSLAMK